MVFFIFRKSYRLNVQTPALLVLLLVVSLSTINAVPFNRDLSLISTKDTSRIRSIGADLAFLFQETVLAGLLILIQESALRTILNAFSFIQDQTLVHTGRAVPVSRVVAPFARTVALLAPVDHFI